MQKLLLGLALILFTVVPVRSHAAQPGERVIAQGGRSEYIIRLCKNPTLTEEYAARELQRYLAEMTGANLFMREGAYLANMPDKTICVGVDDQVKALVPDLDWEKLGREEMVIRTVGNRLILAGGRPRGTLYSVYSFLDEELGCRWFTPDCSRIPKQSRLVLRDIRRGGAPRLEYRCGFYSNMWQDRAWAVRNYDNGATAGENIGGQLMMWGFVHSALGLVPPGKYWKDHPEYYAYNEGSKTRGASQLCLTHPDVLKIAIESVRETLRKDPTLPFVTVSQEDNFGFCQCPNCKAVNEEEGSHSGTLIRFVNRVAEAIEKEYPNTAVGTLAYQVHPQATQAGQAPGERGGAVMLDRMLFCAPAGDVHQQRLLPGRPPRVVPDLQTAFHLGLPHEFLGLADAVPQFQFVGVQRKVLRDPRGDGDFRAGRIHDDRGGDVGAAILPASSVALEPGLRDDEGDG